MANSQFVARNGIISLNDIQVTGSITATGGINISGSITSASYAQTASYALTASYVNPLNQNVLVTGSLALNQATAPATNSPILTVAGNVSASSALAQGTIFTPTLIAAANNDVLVGLDINPTFNVGVFTGVVNYAAIIRGTTNTYFFSSGNVGINQSTDAGFRLNVNGTARISGVLTLSSTITNGTYTYTLPGATGTLALTSQLNSGTVTSVAALTLGTTGTDLSSSVANSTTTPVITLNVPTANATNRGALSSADWTTFNSKQAAYTNLTSIGSLTNGTGWLYNNGSGTFSYTSPTKTTVGLGNVENTALSTWAGTSNITTVGTLSSGSIPYSLLTGTPSLSGYVPYSGATSLVDLNGQQLSNVLNLNINDQINGGYSNASDGIALSVNYNGYQASSSYYRDFNVFDGKHTQIIGVSGSNKTFTLYGSATLTGALSGTSATFASNIVSNGSINSTLLAGLAGANASSFVAENDYTTGVVTSSYLFAGAGTSIKASIRAAVYGDGYMDFATNDNSVKMRLTASGNLGLGTTSPDFASTGNMCLTLEGQSTRARINLQNSSTSTSGVAGTVSAWNGTTFLGSMDIGADGATNSGYFNFYVSNAGSNINWLNVSHTGAATFISSVTATSATFASSGDNTIIQNSTSSAGAYTWYQANGSNKWYSGMSGNGNWEVVNWTGYSYNGTSISVNYSTQAVTLSGYLQLTSPSASTIYLNNTTTSTGLNWNLNSRNDGYFLIGRNGVRNDLYFDPSGNTYVAGALSGTSASFGGDVQGQYLTLHYGSLNNWYSNATDEVGINYSGYNNGTTQFRNLTVYNGKNTQLFQITGSTGAATFSGSITQTGSGYQNMYITSTSSANAAVLNFTTAANSSSMWTMGKRDDGIGGTAAGNFMLTDGAGALVFYVDNSRQMHIANAATFSSSVTAGGFFETSDERLKKVIKRYATNHGFAAVDFIWKKTGVEDFGYIAQEVEKVIPFAVHTRVDGFKEVNYNKANLYKIMRLEDCLIKEHATIHKRIDELEAELKTLKERLK